MSRASDLRDAIKTAVAANGASSGYTVERRILPRYRKEDLVDGPRIFVWIASRLDEFRQGPDKTEILIGVGVAGAGPDYKLITADISYEDAELSQCDSYGETLESLLSLWKSGGALQTTAAEHGFRRIERGILMDSKLLETDGVYLSYFLLAYRDSED